MKINLQFIQSEKGYSLVLVTVLGAVGLSLLGCVLQWAASSSRLIERNNQYFTSVFAAEAATEQVIAQINSDFYYKGENEVVRNLNNNSYRTNFPNVAAWKNFAFTDVGNSVGTFVTNVSTGTYTNLDPRYAGLFGFASLYRVISNASEKNTRQTGIIGAIKQDIWVTTIPIFQMAAFSTGNLEINPGEDMNIMGRVHSNSNIFVQPNSDVTLSFRNDVTAVGKIFNDKNPDDPLDRGTTGIVKHDHAYVSGADSLNVPIGTNTSANAIHKILEIPPSEEDANSVMGQQRYYNKADLQILLSNGGLTVKTPGVNGVFISSSQAMYFISTNFSFYNRREQKNVKAIQIDIAKFRSFISTNVSLTNLNMDVLYVADTRTMGSTEQSGVRLINGQRLPDSGLTIATPNPLYVQGDYNITDGFSLSLGTNTAFTRPASLAADAITVLSGNWEDANATDSLSHRTASSTTINAAFLAGNVETTKGEYSGGLENFPRFLEDWSAATFTYNGSMVIMFKSEIATGLWKGTGDTYSIYNPPKRNWAFDFNFMQSAKLPPATPGASKTYRKQWDVIAPHTAS
jgi:hypothetical protein